MSRTGPAGLWHEGPLVRAELGLFVLALVAALFLYMRVLNARKRRELEALVRERTDALARQIDETRARETEVREWAELLEHRVQDRTAELELAKRALQRSEERYELAAEGAEYGIWDWDITSGVLYLSRRFKDMVGHGQAFGSTIEDWISHAHPDDQDGLRAALTSLAQNGGSISHHYRLLGPAGESYALHCRGLALMGREGPVRAAGSQSPGAPQKSNSVAPRSRDKNDRLTGLPERSAFVQRLEEAHGQALASHSGLTLILFNVDHLRRINDEHGLAIGDKVLRMVAERALTVIESAGMAARLGSDEFALLFHGERGEAEITETVRRLRAALVIPVASGTTTRTLSLSFGIQAGSAQAGPPDAFLRDAQLALHDARTQGGGAVVRFTAELGQDFEHRMRVEVGLRRALRDDQFVLHYQPLISLQTSKIVGFEALIRWNDPRRGLVGPGGFIAIAEASGLMDELSQWVLSEATQQVARWRDELGVTTKVSINLSPRVLTDPKLYENVMSEVERQGIHPQSLGIEILETSLLDTSPAVVEQLRLLKAKGVGIAIDDFGTGYSGLAYLSKIPLTSVKLDRSLVTKVPEDPTESAICKTLVHMARHLEVTSVVEGVETEAQAAFLRSIGCDVAQGFYFARPTVAAEAGRLLISNLGGTREAGPVTVEELGPRPRTLPSARPKR